MNQTEKLALAVFIDFDNIQIGVKTTLNREFDVAIVLDALRERGEVVTKIAYGDWHRTGGDYSRAMAEHAVQMVQRTVTPRGDKNGADINLSLDALEMAFTRHHINTFAIVGGDSDFIALVEKLKQYGKRVVVVGGKSFTSAILQRNCHEFIAYEHLLQRQEAARTQRSRKPKPSPVATLAPIDAMPQIRRCLEVLSDREVTPQLGLIKSTLLQLDPTFSERDYGCTSFREFVQELAKARQLKLIRQDNGFVVELLDSVEEEEPRSAPDTPAARPEKIAAPSARADRQVERAEAPAEPSAEPVRDPAQSLPLLRAALAKLAQESGYRTWYVRRLAAAMRAIDPGFDLRSFGFAGVNDLVMYAQREGVVRTMRDRSGTLLVWGVGQPGNGRSAATEQRETGEREAEPAVAVPEQEMTPVVEDEPLGEPVPQPVPVDRAEPANAVAAPLQTKDEEPPQKGEAATRRGTSRRTSGRASRKKATTKKATSSRTTKRTRSKTD